ncbi:MAG: hypothetical protein ACI9S8_000499 [Chlamydiales bacterium]|jgi:hypothetical protein
MSISDIRSLGSTISPPDTPFRENESSYVKAFLLFRSTLEQIEMLSSIDPLSFTELCKNFSEISPSDSSILT